ncbi:MAG: type IV pilus assembly protein PilM [Sedimentisphaerales bacterium]|nr:type IV pilus assembly protein PilM [Sedimentisphaerales bacterium]MBN2842792.1 type IV pilus assembly protein PilM [Sedimentisphaerales bacterium]
MAKTAGTAWGIDLGNNALKAIKISRGDNDKVQVLDYAVIEHESILTSPEITPGQRTEMIKAALEKFTSEHDLSGCRVVVGVPGTNSFARFAKLPPVDKKRIPDMVRYEAQQQIPFDINDVEWDWQVLNESEDAQEIEIGIFAIKSDIVKRVLMPYADSNILIDSVQMIPMALFNFLDYDKSTANAQEAVILLDIGAENTDLVISNKGRVWQRSIKIGGNHFTAAVQKSFKLSFQKAENIKRTANTSKYARQIFQAMRPVFSDLAAEIQRSLGFYMSGNRDTQFGEALAMGNAVKLPGLLKFLQQSLSMPIKRIDNFDRLTTSEEVSVAEFTGHIPSITAAYGLALQGLGEGSIAGDLLPREIIRQTQWKRKHKWFAAACACMILGGSIQLVKGISGSSDIAQAQSLLRTIQADVSRVNDSASVKDNALSSISEITKIIDNHKKIYQDRSLIQRLYKSLVESLPSPDHNPEQAELFKAYFAGELENVLQTPREDRKQVFIAGIKMVYTEDLTQSFDAILSSSTGTGGGMAMSMGRGGMDQSMGGFARGLQTTEIAATPSATTEAEAPRAGFVLILEGSTPHRDNLAFLNPPTVGLDRSKWGFFTRLYNLGKTDEQIKKELEAKNATVDIAPADEYQKQQNELALNLPFESFIGSKDLKSYFDTDEGAHVSGNSNTTQPLGIGIPKPGFSNTGAMAGGMRGGFDMTTTNNEQLPQMIDPFTQEVISTEYKENNNGSIVLEGGKPITVNHDYWFRVKMKIALKTTDNTSAGM